MRSLSPRRGAAWHRQARQATNSQLSSRIYSRVILAEPRSRNFAPALARRTDTSYDVFCSGTKDCTARIASPLFSSAVRPTALTRPLKVPYRPAKSGDYPRTIVPGVYESARPAATCPPIARLDTLVIATAELPPASPPEQSSSSAALLGRVHRRRRAISELRAVRWVGALITNGVLLLRNLIIIRLLCISYRAGY